MNNIGMIVYSRFATMQGSDGALLLNVPYAYVKSETDDKYIVIPVDSGPDGRKEFDVLKDEVEVYCTVGEMLHRMKDEITLYKNLESRTANDPMILTRFRQVAECKKEAASLNKRDFTDYNQSLKKKAAKGCRRKERLLKNMFLFSDGDRLIKIAEENMNSINDQSSINDVVNMLREKEEAIHKEMESLAAVSEYQEYSII